MGQIIIIGVLTLLGWLAFIAVCSLNRRGVGSGWWTALVGCVGSGFALGVWLGFFFEYQPEPKFRVIGCPVPVVCFVLEKDRDGEEHWVDYVTPVPLFFATSNVVLLSIVSIYPVWLANTLWRFEDQKRTRKKPEKGTSLSVDD
jgi:hypothetical protein